MAAFASPKAEAPTQAPDLRALFPGRSIILNIGQLEARKNQRYLLDVAAELRHQRANAVVVLVGTGEDEALLRARIAELGLADDVVLLGYQPQVGRLLRAADLYVHTATHENCPYVIIEAIASGCPVVALAAGGSPELLVTTPEASIAQGTTPAALARQLAGFLGHRAALDAMRARQFDYARARFDISTMVRNTISFYRQVVGPEIADAAPASCPLAAPTIQPT